MSGTEINALPAVLSCKPHNGSVFVLIVQMKLKLREVRTYLVSWPKEGGESFKQVLSIFKPD